MGRVHTSLGGMVFGKLTAIRFVLANENGDAQWQCKCECGTDCFVFAKSLLDKRRGTKSCGCLYRKPLCPKGHEFTPENTYLNPKGHRRCRTCKAETAVNTKTKNFEKITKRQRYWKLSLSGWTQELFDKVLEEQKGKCRICLKPMRTDVKMSKDRACADHEHCDPPKPRGILCNPCNAAIGLLQDSPDLLRKAAEYLENFKEK